MKMKYKKQIPLLLEATKCNFDKSKFKKENVDVVLEIYNLHRNCNNERNFKNYLHFGREFNSNYFLC